MSTLNFNVSGDPSEDQPVLISDNPPGGTFLEGHFEGVPGQLPNRYSATVPPEITGGATLYYQNKQKHFRVIVPPGPGQWEAGQPPCIPPEYGGDVERVAMKYAPVFVALSRLIPHGHYFRSEVGRFTVIDTTEFALLHRLLYEGEAAIEPVLQQRQDAGFNMRRVLATCSQMFHLFPQEHGQAFYDAITKLSDLLARHQSYLNLVVHADAVLVTPDANEQLRLWSAIGEVAQGKTNILLSYVNEADQNVNRVDGSIDRVPPIPGVLCSRGSNGFGEDVGPRPWIDWEETHINGFEWWRKSHNTMECSTGNEGMTGSRRPAVSSETARADDRDADPNHHEDDGAVASLLCAGKTYHSKTGRFSQLWPDGGGEFACAVASARGSRSVPLEFQDGAYTRHTNPPGIIRVYRRTLSDGRFHEVLVRG